MTGAFAAIDRYWMAPAPAARLGAVRIAVGVFAVLWLAGRLPHSLSYAGFPDEAFRPVGVVGWFLDRPLEAWAVYAQVFASLALSIPFLLGWRLRLLGPPFAALMLWTITYNNSWGMVFHTENLLVLHVIILAASASADGWSLDARRLAAPPDDHGRYGWPLKLMCWVVVLAYVLAGIAKLRNSPDGWLWGDDLRNYIAMDNARKALLGDAFSPIAAPLMRYDTVYKVMALATIALEVGAPIALLHRKLAALWSLAIWGFHASVVALMWIVFAYPLSGVAFVPFFRAEKLADRLARIARRILRRLTSNRGP